MKPEVPDGSPEHAHRAKDPERDSPSQAALQGDDQQRRERTAKAAGGPDQTLGARVLRDGKPSRHYTGRVRICPGFSSAEQKTRDQQDAKTGGRTRQAGERGPPDYDASQHFALAGTVAQSTCGNFESAVGKHEGAQHPTPAIRWDAELLLYGRTGHGDTDPVKERHNGESDQQQQDNAALLQTESLIVVRETRAQCPAWRPRADPQWSLC